MLMRIASARSTAGTSASAHSILVRLLERLLGRTKGEFLDPDAEESSETVLHPRLRHHDAPLAPCNDAL